MTRDRVVRVAAVQAVPAFLDLAGGLERLRAWTRRAAAGGAAIVVFPETWLPGYPVWIDSAPAAALWDAPAGKEAFARLSANAVEVPGPAVDAIGDIARECGVTLVVCVHERAGRTLYNALLTFGPDGGIANHHRKLVPTYTERLLWAPGDGHGLRTTAAAGARLGGLVCWEHWMPLPRQVLHDAGEEIHVAVWPWVREPHLVASRHYAFEGRCFVVAAGSVLRASDLPDDLTGSLPFDRAAAEASLPPGATPAGEGVLALRSADDYFLQRGGSCVIAPDGSFVAAPVYDAETLIVADCDLDAIAREAMTLDVSGHYARPDLFALSFSPGPARPRR